MSPAAANGAQPRIAGIALLFGAIYFIQSIGDPGSGLIAQPVRSLLERAGEGPAAIASFMAIMALPWSLKPLLALLSDFVPFLGSRRKSYLVLSTAAAALGLGVLYVMPLAVHERTALMLLLFVPTIGIAFTDVLADALMIEVGKPRGLTGLLQSAQWFAAYFALLLAGVVGGWLTATDRHALAFLLCAALWAASCVLAIVFVREPRREASSADALSTWRELRGAVAARGLLAIGAISFVWDANLLSGTVNYLHVTDTLGLSEQTFGNGSSLFAAGAMAATVVYAALGRWVSAGFLINIAIAAGILANIFYAFVASAPSYYVVSVLVGFAYMTGSLILLDLAARLVPVAVAATVFAAIMALANLGSSAAELAGGVLYESASVRFGAGGAYVVTLAAAVAVIAASWLWVPLLRRTLSSETQPRLDSAPR